ncbi:hypothetical protein OIU76_007127 [Salix suchowensis]|nr:hypothetical protein OIU76_007127 [Salix suchowensis]
MAFFFLAFNQWLTCSRNGTRTRIYICGTGPFTSSMLNVTEYQKVCWMHQLCLMTLSYFCLLLFGEKIGLLRSIGCRTTLL